MSDHKRPITINLDGRGVGSLKLGDVDLSNETMGASVRIRAGRVPVVTVEMLPGRLAADVLAEVHVDQATRAALIELGWTPPGCHTPKLAEPEALAYLRARAEAAQTERSANGEFVLTWHPVTDDDPVEVPLGEQWVLPGTDVSVGEFRLSTREVPAAPDVEPAEPNSAEADRA